MRYQILRFLAATCVTLTLAASVHAQSAKVQFVNAAPDIRVSTIDVYADGVLLIDNLAYAKATAALEVPVGTVDLAITAASASSAEEAFATIQQRFYSNLTYWAVVHGVTTPRQYPANPEARATDLTMSFQVRSRATIPSGEFRIRMFNALLDSEALDFWLDGTSEDYTIRDGIEYGSFSSLIQGAPAEYKGYVTPDDQAWPRLIDLEPIDFAPYEGKSILEIPIGLFDRNASYRYNLKWLWVLDDGTTKYSAINSRPAEVQFIAAAAEQEFGSVDIWVDGFKVAGNVDYMRCTPAIPVTAGLPLELAIAPAGSSSPAEALYAQEIEFDSRKSHHAILAGVSNPATFPANPAGRDIQMKVFVDRDAAGRAGPGSFVLRFFHARTDLGEVDFWEGHDLDYQVMDDLSFGQFSRNEYPSARPYWGTLTLGDDVERELYRGVGDFSGFGGKSLISVLVDGFGTELNTQMVTYSMDGAEYTAMITDAEDAIDVPGEFVLHANYPNPFNPSTVISFDVPEATWVRLEIYDLLGRRVTTLLDAHVLPGSHTTTWQPSADVPSGMYIYSITTDSWRASRPMTLLQ